ncbi:hypothetical protein [Methanobacterium ferruginis]|uniref:hypothetical protein n=1 Tax=Methanobacterium ferruginis TaxID=710191 RepID=UPI0025732A77|nr:hypothetical protein [Methanobacterium ferruginis]BDZ68587.1 hypothetical protein GCM10025860_20350 [Methanobacterium ferruginis]
MDLESVIWISSINHLDDIVKLIKSSSFSEILLRNFSLPEGFPRAKNKPCAYFSRGDLTIKDDALEYNSFDDSDSKYQNLKEDLSFVLNRSNIKSFEKYPFKEFHPYGLIGTVYIQNWIRIICDDDILGGDFLIGSDSVRNINKLFKMLEQLTEGQQVTERLETNSEKYVLIGYFGIILAYLQLIVWNFFLFLTAFLLIIIFVIWSYGRSQKVMYHLKIILITMILFIVLLKFLYL